MSGESTLRLVEPLADQDLGALGASLDERRRVLVDLERREQPVGERPAVPPLRSADAAADTQEVGPAERLGRRAEPVVSLQAAARSGLDPPERQLDLVVDDDDLFRSSLWKRAALPIERPLSFMKVSGISSATRWRRVGP
jgi:hypothetical protein